MLEATITLFFTTVISPVVGYFIGVRNERLSKKTIENEALGGGIVSLLGYELYKLWSESMKRGHISTEEVALMKEIYESYHSLGGNGVGTERMNDLIKLPRSDEK